MFQSRKPELKDDINKSSLSILTGKRGVRAAVGQILRTVLRQRCDAHWLLSRLCQAQKM